MTGASRYPGLDDIATFGEQGLPGFEIGGGSALFGPAQLGQPIVERVHAEIVRIIARHDTVQFFHTMGWTPTGSAPNTLRENLTSTSNVWGPLIRRLGIKAD